MTASPPEPPRRNRRDPRDRDISHWHTLEYTAPSGNQSQSNQRGNREAAILGLSVVTGAAIAAISLQGLAGGDRAQPREAGSPADETIAESAPGAESPGGEPQPDGAIGPATAPDSPPEADGATAPEAGPEDASPDAADPGDRPVEGADPPNWLTRVAILLQIRPPGERTQEYISTNPFSAVSETLDDRGWGVRDNPLPALGRLGAALGAIYAGAFAFVRYFLGIKP